MSFVSSKGNILCRLIIIELYEIFALINRAIKGLHCTCIEPFNECCENNQHIYNRLHKHTQTYIIKYMSCCTIITLLLLELWCMQWTVPNKTCTTWLHATCRLYSFYTVWKIYLWKQCSVECRYNAVEYYKIFHTALHWLKHDINQCQITNCTPYLALTGEIWGTICENCKESDRVITAPHCISCFLSTLVVICENDLHSTC